MKTHYAHVLCSVGTQEENGQTVQTYLGILPHHTTGSVVEDITATATEDYLIEPGQIVVKFQGTEAQLDAAAADPNITELFRDALPQEVV